MTDPNYYQWLGLVVSWIVFPALAIQSFLRYRTSKKRIDFAITTVALGLFVLKILTNHY
jgi:predicted permease